MNKEQIALLRKVKRHILRKPSRLRMNNWIVKAEPNSSVTLGEGWGEPTNVKIPSCGTVGCIAGWIVLLSNNNLDNSNNYSIKSDGKCKVFSAQQEATILLGFKYVPTELFFVSDWPYQKREEYFNSTSQTQRAKIVGQVIDDFIKSHSEDSDARNA